jgi:hypothetical protein
MLAESRITPDHARERGYVTVDTKIRLEMLRITKAGRNVPGLLVPMRDKAGGVWGYQFRPDVPRLNGSGGPVKYETPVGQRNGIDVPPGVGPALDDPTVPLWITEGCKKADAAACAGIACVALAGVWSWRGANGNGGKVAVPDWHDIALNGRPVVLAFDSDVMVKPPVRKGADRAVRLPGVERRDGSVSAPTERRPHQDRLRRLPRGRPHRHRVGLAGPARPAGARQGSAIGAAAATNGSQVCT